MNLKKPEIEHILEKHGALGLGAYILIKNALITYSKISDIVASVSHLVERNLVEDILKNSGLFFSVDGINYKHHTEKRTDLDVNDAYAIFDKNFPEVRFFDRMRQVHGMTEAEVQSEFGKWKKSNEHNLFNDDRHLRNSFNYWLSKAEKPKKITEIDWSKI